MKQFPGRLCSNVSKAVKKAKERHIEKLVEKLEGIDVDVHAAWQVSLQLQAGHSHHHVDIINKHIKLKELVFVQLQNDLFIIIIS